MARRVSWRQWTRKPKPVVRGPQLDIAAARHVRRPPIVTWTPHSHNYVVDIGGACECGVAGRRCNQCGAEIPATAARLSTRGKRDAFGGRGRPREFCGATCRKRWSRR